MQRQEVLIHDNLRVVLFRSFLKEENVNLLYHRLLENLPADVSEITLFLQGATSLDSLVKEYADFFVQKGFFTSRVEVEKYASKTNSQGGLFLFLGKAQLQIGTEITISVSFGDLLSVRGGDIPVKVTSEEGRMFVLHFLETDPLSKYRQMSLRQLEELAYAVQIAYTPPLTEAQRPNILQGIKWILEHPNLTEEEKETSTKASRIKTCDNPNTPVGYDNVLLKSDAQLAFLPDSTSSGEVYYCLDKVVDLPETLRQEKNLSNMKPLTPEQVHYLEEVRDQNSYPRIATGDYFDEVASRLQGQVEAAIPLYRRRAEELAELVKEVGLDYSSGAIISFANNLTPQQYNDYLRHRSFQQNVEVSNRDEAATEALGILLRYYTQKNQISIEQGGYALREIGKTVEEYVAMVQNKWDYSTLLSEMGTEGELYWQPKRRYPDETSDLIREGHVTSDGRRIDEWLIKYPNGNPHSRGNYDQNGQRTGNWTFWFGHGQKKLEAHFINNLATGHWIFWHGNGIKRLEGDYFNDLKTGFFTEWYDNGKKKLEGNFLNNQKTGHWVIWYDNENKKEEGEYLHDEKTGPWTEWYTTGIKKSQGNYLHGKETGHWVMWQTNENKKAEGDYLHGKETGLWTIWKFPNTDQKTEEGNYLDGQKTGLWTTWYYGGQKEDQGEYLLGKKTGRWTNWYDNGKKEKEGKYLHNEKTGPWTIYYESGQKKKEGEYIEGLKTGLWKVYFNDQKVEEGEYLEGLKTGRWIEWHENGKKNKEGDYLHGQKTGRWVEWHYEGQKESEGNYLDDLKTGHWIEWHHNGVKESEGDYLEHKKTGFWIEWHNNGSKRSEGSYFKGDKTARWVEFYSNGKKQKEGSYLEHKKTGLWVEWYDNGQKREKGTYTKGRKVGDWLSYYSNGIVKDKNFFGNGIVTNRISVEDDYGNYYDSDDDSDDYSNYDDSGDDSDDDE